MSKYTALVMILFVFNLICWTGCAATSSAKTKDNAFAGSSEASDTAIFQKRENIRKLIKISGNADSILLQLQRFYDNQMTQLIQRLRPDLSKKNRKETQAGMAC